MTEPRHGQPWSPQEVEEAVKMRRGYRSAAEIAAALGRTRNAIISKLHREGEPGVLVAKGLPDYKGALRPDCASAPRRMSWEHADGR